MKRFIAGSEQVARCLMANPSSVTTWTYQAELYLVYLIGDVNADGEVNMADVTKIERIILGIDPLIFLPPLDANMDGEVNMADVTKIERMILGVDPFPPPVKVATSGIIEFTLEPLEDQVINFPIVMPEQQWIYQVYLDVLVRDVLIAAYQATDPVEVVEPSSQYEISELTWQNAMPFVANSQQQFNLMLTNRDSIAHRFKAEYWFDIYSSGEKSGTLYPGNYASVGGRLYMPYQAGVYMLTINIYWDDILVETMTYPVEVI